MWSVDASLTSCGAGGFVVCPSNRGSCCGSGLDGPELEPYEAAHVVGEVGQPDLDPGALETDGADDEPHQSLLVCEHMFDRAAHLGLLRIGNAGALGHRFALRLLAMNGEYNPRRVNIAS